MIAALNRFRSNLQRARESRTLYLALRAAAAPGGLDLTDLLRFAIVAAVSAFDAFVHELTRLGMLEIFSGARPTTPAFDKFSLPMGVVVGILGRPASAQLLEDEIRSQHGLKSFQLPDKVADAVRLFSEKELWREVAAELGLEPRSAKARLSLIIDRRNKIVHEADIDPSSPGSQWPIDEGLVEEAVQTLSDLAEAIFRAVKDP